MLNYLKYSLLLGVVTTAFATQWQCPGNNNFVTEGDSIKTVMQQCGKPKQIIKHNPNNTTGEKLLWVYTIYDPSGGGPDQTVYVLLQNGKVKGIRNEVAYTGVAQVKVLQQLNCGGGVVKLNDDLNQLTTNCGVPAKQYVLDNNQVAPTANAAQKKQSALVYQPYSYAPSKVFIFIDGKLAGQE